MGGAGGDFPQVREVPREGHAGLQAAHVGKVREEGEDSEESPVRPHRGRRRHAEHPVLSLPDPARLAPLEGLPVRQDPGDEVAELGGLGQQPLEVLAPDLPVERQDLPPGFVQLDHRSRGIDREEARRQAARERARGRLEIVGALLLEARQTRQLPLFLGKGRDRGLEARDQELPLVAEVRAGRRGGPGRPQHPVERIEERAEVEAREHDERRAGERHENGHQAREPAQARPRPGIECHEESSLARGHPREQDGRLPLPLVGDAAARRPVPGENRRSGEAVPRALHAAAARVVDADEENVRLEERALERVRRGGGGGVRGERQPPKQLAGATLGDELAPEDRVSEEEEGDEVQEQDQEQRDPEEEPGFPAKRSRDAVGLRAGRRGRRRDRHGVGWVRATL